MVKRSKSVWQSCVDQTVEFGFGVFRLLSMTRDILGFCFEGVPP